MIFLVPKTVTMMSFGRRLCVYDCF